MFVIDSDMVKLRGITNMVHRYSRPILNKNTDMHNYRPQRSLGKVMFSQACVILFTGGVSASVPAEIPPPSADTHSGSRHPPGAEHAGRYGQRAGGTHPTGMQTRLCVDLN